MNKLKSHIFLLSCFLAALVAREAEAQFSIGPGGYVTVKAGGSMMIGTDVHIKSVDGASGYLVDQNVNGDITITGNVQVDRYMTANRWHNVASPVSNEASDCFTNTDLVFWYNEALIFNDWNFGWVWYTGATGGPLMVFRGYDVYFATNPVTVNYMASGAETLNTGPYSITVINTSSTPGEIASHKGWNLLGNPYPSPADWLAASGWNKASINDYKYIWDGANNIYTIFGGSPPIGVNGGTRFIPSNQGFWVQSTVASGSVGINNAVRVGDITGTPDFYKAAPIDYPMVSLLAGGNGFTDEIVIRFLEGTTEGFDLNKDASKLFGFHPDVPQISIISGKNIFALNSLPEIREDLAVSVDFRCGKAGYYTLGMTARTVLESDTRLYLKDERLQKLVNLRSDSTYGFYHEPSFPENRFKVYFNPSEDVLRNLTIDNYFTILTEGKTIIIVKNTVKEVTGQVNVYNMMGQPVWRGSMGFDPQSRISIDVPTGYYIVNIQTDQYVYNTKILVIN